MKSFVLSALACGVAALPMVASAQYAGSTQLTRYGELGLNFLSIDIEDDLPFISEDSIDLEVLTGRLGAAISPYLSVEGELSFGLGDDEVAGVDVNLNYAFAGYLRGEYPLSPEFTIFGRFGLIQAEVGFEAGSIDDTESGGGVALGFGGEYRLQSNFYLRADYTKYDIDDLDGDSLTVAVGYDF